MRASRIIDDVCLDGSIWSGCAVPCLVGAGGHDQGWQQ